MFLLLLKGEEATQAAEHATEKAGAAHHMPILVEKVNELIGGPVHQLQLKYTKPLWDRFFAKFETNAEAVFGAYTAENAVPWYTIMFIVACFVSVGLIWLFTRKLSEDDPSDPQQTLEVGVLFIRNMLAEVVGPHGLKYFPVVATFGVLILVSNLMGFFPLFMAPTASTSVTFALGLSAFLYYNYVGIKENGLLGHLGHFAGPVWWIAPLIFLIELVSHFIRPLSLGIRLFGNMFADHQVAENMAGLYPPLTYWLIPIPLMFLGVLIALIQAFVFVLLSMVYLSEVSHPPHDEHGEKEHDASEELAAPALT